MPADVFRELLDRCVAALRFFAHRLQYDVVQIAFERFQISIAASDGRARFRRFLLRDGAGDFSAASAFDAVWTLSGKELVQNHPKTVSIARSGLRFSLPLFRSC